MIERKLFGHPIRNETTRSFYPHKLTLEQFCEEIKGSVEPFQENMIGLGGVAQEEKYIEEWTEQFLAWCEIEEER
jgi:choline-glycine betaine transporter